MSENTSENFDGYRLIDELIAETGLQDEDPSKLARLKEAMLEDLTRRLFRAARENVEPEVMDAVMEEMRDETDAGMILRELIRTSPSAQLALLAAVDEFRDFTLTVLNQEEN